MFKKTKDGIIKYDKIFTVKIIGRAGIEYQEGDKRMLIDSEMLADEKIGFVITLSSINHWKGSKQKMEKKDQLRILNNIKEAISFIGYKIKVIRDF